MCPAVDPTVLTSLSVFGVSGVVGLHAFAEFPPLAGIQYVSVVATAVGIQSVAGIAVGFPTVANIPAVVGVAVVGEFVVTALLLLLASRWGFPAVATWCCCWRSCYC